MTRRRAQQDRRSSSARRRSLREAAYPSRFAFIVVIRLHRLAHTWRRLATRRRLAPPADYFIQGWIWYLAVATLAGHMMTFAPLRICAVGIGMNSGPYFA